MVNEFAETGIGKRAKASIGAPVLLICAAVLAVGIVFVAQAFGGTGDADQPEKAHARPNEAKVLWSPRLRAGMSTEEVVRAMGEPGRLVRRRGEMQFYYVHRLDFENGRLVSTTRTAHVPPAGEVSARHAEGAAYKWIGSDGRPHGTITFYRDGTFSVDSEELKLDADFVGCTNRWEVTEDGLELDFMSGKWRFRGPFRTAFSSGRLAGQYSGDESQGPFKWCQLDALDAQGHQNFLATVNGRYRDARRRDSHAGGQDDSGLQPPGRRTAEQPRRAQRTQREEQLRGYRVIPRKQTGLHQRGIHLWPYRPPAYLFFHDEGGLLVVRGRLRSIRRETQNWARLKITAGATGRREVEGSVTLHNLRHMENRTFRAVLGGGISAAEVVWADIQWEDGD